MTEFRVFAAIVAGAAVSACGTDGSRPAPATPPVAARTEPSAPSAPRVRAVADAAPAPVPPDVELATRILMFGRDAIHDEGRREHDTSPGAFSYRLLAEFLDDTYVAPAVQFSCSYYFPEQERALVAVLQRTPESDERRVLALAALLRVRAPREIDAQWRALCRLDLRHRDDPGWSAVLRELRAPFAASAIDEALKAEPPAGRFGDAVELEWAARAAGVTLHAGAIPRLVELSIGPHLHVSLAAERSLEDFAGPDGDRALAACLLGWQYDAYVRAGRALRFRNPELLETTLVGAAVPEGARYQAGLLLASVGNAAAVPHLCASVGGEIAIVDDKMFDAIEELTTDEQLPLVDALPRSVRIEQRERAKSVVAAVHARLGR